MTILDTKELFDDTGCLPIWGHMSASGKPYYMFQLTDKDKYIFFPTTMSNPKAPKFQLKKINKEKLGAEE